jgi:hypothetical protein
MRFLGCAVFALAATLAACASDNESPGGPPTSMPSTAADRSGAPPAGWNEFAVDEYSIWLPASYVGGDIAEDRDVVLDRIRSANPVCGAGLEALADSSPTARLIAVDVDTCSVDAVRTNVGVNQQDVPKGTTPKEYLEQAASSVPASVEILEQGLTTVGGRDVARLVVESDTEKEILPKSLIVALPARGSYWLVICTTSPDEFGARLDEFERIVLTFENSLPG